jgi:signal transduction histidine kinase
MQKMDDTTVKNLLKNVLDDEDHLANFILSFSHEFRTPLSVILLELEQLIRKTKDCLPVDLNELQASIRQIRKNSLRMTRAINNLIDTAEAGIHRMHLQIAPFNVIGDIQDVIACVQQFTGKENIRFINRSGKNRLIIQADQYMFERVLLNLISNALKYAKKGTTVHIDLNINETEITVSVTNKGNGLEQNIFENRNHFRLASNTDGLGIGLLLVKSIVELHHGRV